MDQNAFTYHEFLTFCLLMAAKSNFEISEMEQNYLTDHPELKQVDLNKIKSIHQKNSDKENIDILLGYRNEFYPTVEKQQQLINEVGKIMTLDGETDTNETEFMMMFRKLISSENI